MAELVMQGVSKTYAGHAAVQDLDLTIRDQELIVLVGPSGCGKTTTLRLIAGLDEPSCGAIWIDGRRVNQVAARDRNIAMVFQHSALYPHLTVFENIAFGLRMRQRTRRAGTGSGGQRRAAAEIPRGRRAIAEAVRQASKTLGLEHLLDRKPHELSGGERQRVALGRAIVRQPAAFLFDEPLAHLDPQQRAEMRRIIKRIHLQSGVTMIYVTHDQAEAMSLGDRIVVMDRGRIEQVGSPRELYRRPDNQFVARFLGEPAMNLVSGRIEVAEGQPARFVGGGLAVVLDCGNRFRPPAGRVVLGIRPEQIWIEPDPPVGSNHESGSDSDADARRGPCGQAGWRGPPSRCWCGVGSVTQTEPLGAVTVLSVTVGREAVEVHAGDSDRSQELQVIRPADTGLDVGQPVAIGMDQTRVHWFDVNTGESLCGAAKSGGDAKRLWNSGP